MREENTVPVWSGCFAPFQLVTFDNEEWTPSLSEINARSYAVARLFRSSLNIDVGIAPLSLMVIFDGTLVLPACPEVPTQKRALTIFNRHLTTLLLGGMSVQEVAPDDVTPGSLNFWGYHRHHCPVGRYTKLSQALRTARGGPDELVMLYRPKQITKTQYSKYHASGLALSRVLPSNFSTVWLPACTAYANENWERALILGWTSIELMIEQLWQARIVTGTEISGVSRKRRRDFLNDTRTWSSSARIELLSQKGAISDSMYAQADKARSARNAFIHSADETSPEAAKLAVEASLSLISTIAEEANIPFGASNLMKLLDESTQHFRTPIADEHGRLLIEPELWRYPDPAPGFKDWGDRPFEKFPEIELKPIDPNA